METTLGLPTLQTILLSCGIIAALLYLGTDRLAGRLLKGYSFSAQSMSELSAAGSPTRSLVVSLTFVACAFLIAFGVGVWGMAGQALLPRVVAGLIFANAIAGLIATTFFPTRFGESPVFQSTGVIVMLISVLSSVLAMIVGALAFNGWFRIFSIAVPVAFVLLAVLKFAAAASSSKEGAATSIGAQERTMAYSFLLWVAALAVYLLMLTGKGMDAATGLGL